MDLGNYMVLLAWQKIHFLDCALSVLCCAVVALRRRIWVLGATPPSPFSRPQPESCVNRHAYTIRRAQQTQQEAFRHLEYYSAHHRRSTAIPCKCRPPRSKGSETQGQARLNTQGSHVHKAELLTSKRSSSCRQSLPAFDGCAP